MDGQADARRLRPCECATAVCKRCCRSCCASLYTPHRAFPIRPRQHGPEGLKDPLRRSEVFEARGKMQLAQRLATGSVPHAAGPSSSPRPCFMARRATGVSARHPRSQPAPFSSAARRTQLAAVKSDAQVAELDASSLRLISEVSRAVDDVVAGTVAANAEAARKLQAAPVPSTPLRERVLASVRKLSTGLLERDTEVRPRSDGRGLGHGGCKLGAACPPAPGPIPAPSASCMLHARKPHALVRGICRAGRARPSAHAPRAARPPAQVRLMLLAALCCEHLLLLGPPGENRMSPPPASLAGCRVCRPNSTQLMVLAARQLRSALSAHSHSRPQPPSPTPQSSHLTCMPLPCPPACGPGRHGQVRAVAAAVVAVRRYLL
jgi:hypothetical protein